MAYVKHEWKTGDIVSSTKLNQMEDGIFNSQEKITETAKLSADLLSEGTSNKLVSADEKTNWNSKTTVSVPTTSESTAEAKFLKVGDVEYKLATGTGKIWREAELTTQEILSLAQGNEVVRTLDEEYDATNFKNDYFVCKVDQTTYSGARTIWYGENMQKVYVNVDGLATIIPYFTNTVINQIKEVGFDHNYYRTIALYAACDHEEGKEAIRSIDGRDIIYLQDVSQQKWEYNYENPKEAEKIKREELDNDVMGTAVVFSIKGKADDTSNPDCAFLYCLQASQAAYWDSTDGMVKWANIEAGKAYPVTFDTQHDTLRWLLDNVQTVSGKIYGVEMLDGSETQVKTKQWYLKHGIEFSLDSDPQAETKYGSKYRVCAAAVVDKANNIFADCFGVNIKSLSNVFSFNNVFGEANTVKMDYIGRPNCYVIDNYAYTKRKSETEYETIVERNGYHMWTCDVDGVTVQLVIPDNCDAQGKPHRNTYVMSLDLSTAYSTNSIYRHTITVRTGSTYEMIGKYELNLSMCAVNSEAGDSSVDYLLHSDESHQYADWILPVSGTIGKIMGVGKKGDVIKPAGKYNRILISGNFNALNLDNLWNNLPKALDGKYYIFAANKVGETTLEDDNKIRLRIEKVAGQTNGTYDIYVRANQAKAPYRAVCASGAAGGLFYYDTDVQDYVKADARYDYELFTYEESTPAIGLNAIDIVYESTTYSIAVGMDNEILYKIFSAQNDFGEMNVLTHTYQAVRMRAGWQTVEDKDIRTLFVDYVDAAGEWNSVPVITDGNKNDYYVADFRSEVLAVKTPRNVARAQVAVAKLDTK